MSKTKKIAAAVIILGSLIPSIQAMAQSTAPTTASPDASAMASGTGTMSKSTKHQRKAAMNKAKRMKAPATTGAGRSRNGDAAGTPAAASGAGA